MRNRATSARRMPVVGALLVPMILGSCSSFGGSKSSSSDRPEACTFVARLDEIAHTVAAADVRDPAAFKKTLTTSVREYVANLRELRAVAPEELHAGLERVEADVQQFRFDAAVTDRAGLDAYAARSCGRVVEAVTTTSGAPASTGSTTPVSSGG